MRSIAACTITANNYLAFARVFAHSYRTHHPEARVFVCVVDTPHPAIRYDELPFTTVFAHELEIPDFYNLAFRYGVLELSTAVKPFFLSHLRDRFELDRILYFDPDVLVCDTLDDLAESLDHHDAVLTPHITRPLEDDRHPSDRTIAQCGVYNLGFLGLRLDQGTTELLEWWQRRLHRFCRVDLAAGLFVDQSWMDFAPAFLDSVRIAREPIYNVAYWNLAHRRIEAMARPWTVDGRPIGFFHFSGIDLDNLEIVSQHQDRLTLDTHPELRPCFESYRELLLDAGHDDLRHLPHAYDTFLDSDVAIPCAARSALQRVDPRGSRWPNPFDLEGTDTFYRWLVEPLELERGYLNRLALSLWEERPDLRSAFPRVTGEHLPDFVGWLETEIGDGHLAPLFAHGVGAKPPPDRRDAPAPLHDNLVRGLVHDLAALDRPRGLLHWLNEPAAGSPVPPAAGVEPAVTRLAMMLYEMREDLQAEWPDPLGRDRLGFASWFIKYGRESYSLPAAVVDPTARTITPEARRSAEEFQDRKSLDVLLKLVALERPAGLTAWLNEPAESRVERAAESSPVEPRPVITRLAMMLYEMRKDVRIVWPDPLGENRLDFAHWFVVDARREYRLPVDLTAPVASTLPSVTHDAGRPAEAAGPRRDRDAAGGASPAAAAPEAGGKRTPGRGVNLAGCFRQASSVGRLSRATVSVLDRVGMPCARVPLDQHLDSATFGSTIHQPEGLPYPVTLVNADAGETHDALEKMPLAATVKSFKIGHWTWDLSHFPLAFADCFPLLDEVWAGSRFCQKSFDVISTVPVRLVRPFVPPPAATSSDRSRFGLEERRFIFFYALDAGSVAERKNPFAAIEAIRSLRRATSTPVGLFLLLSRAHLDPHLVPRLKRAAEGQPVTLFTGPAPRRTLDAMLSSCDAVLSLHRSEGLGLLLIDGLYLEKPVVATAYGGVTDYLDDRTGFPVEHRLRSLDRDHPPYPRGSVWAEPDVDDAVRRMRQVVEDPAEARRRATEGRRRVESLYGLEAAAARYQRELERIFDLIESRAGRSAARAETEARHPRERLAERVLTGGGIDRSPELLAASRPRR